MTWMYKRLKQAAWLCAVVGGMGALTACTPALDWRELRPTGTALTLLMPCRPGVVERTLPLAGAPLRMQLHSCSADDTLWGLAQADAVDPALVAHVLRALRDAAAANIDADPPQALPLRVAGATPSPEMSRWRLHGKRPDGQPVVMELAVFAHGTRVFQASMLGPGPADGLLREAADTFFASLRLPS